MSDFIIDPYRFAGPLTYDQEVAADSPLGYWKCQEASGVTAADSSGNSRDMAGGAGHPHMGSVQVVHPEDATSCAFQGHASCMLSIVDAAWQSPHAGASGKMTLEAWVNVDTLATIRTLWWKGVSGSLEFGLYVLTTGAIEFTVFTAAGGTAGIATSATGVIAVDTNYHVVATYDRAGNAVKLYVDKVEVASGTTSADSTAGTGNLVFGMRGSNSDRLLLGFGSHLAMYGTALSSTRVAAHYDAA